MSNEKEPISLSAEEILNIKFKDNVPSDLNGKIWDDKLIEAMQEYSDQQTATLQQKLTEVCQQLEKSNEALNECIVKWKKESDLQTKIYANKLFYSENDRTIAIDKAITINEILVDLNALKD